MSDKLMIQLFPGYISWSTLHDMDMGYTHISDAKKPEEIFALFSKWIHASMVNSKEKFSLPVKVLQPVVAPPKVLEKFEATIAKVYEGFHFEKTELNSEFTAGIPIYSGEFTKEFTSFCKAKKNLGKNATLAMRGELTSWAHAPSTLFLLTSGYSIACTSKGFSVTTDSTEFDLSPYKKVSVIAAMLAEGAGFPTGDMEWKQPLRICSAGPLRQNQRDTLGFYFRIPMTHDYNLDAPHQPNQLHWLDTNEGSLSMSITCCRLDLSDEALDSVSYRRLVDTLKGNIQNTLKYNPGLGPDFLKFVDLSCSFSFADITRLASLPFEEFQVAVEQKIKLILDKTGSRYSNPPHYGVNTLKVTSDEIHHRLFKAVAQASQWFSTSGKLLKGKEEDLKQYLEENAPLLVGTKNKVIATLTERFLYSS